MLLLLKKDVLIWGSENLVTVVYVSQVLMEDTWATIHRQVCR